MFRQRTLSRGAALGLAAVIGLGGSAALAAEDFHHAFARNGNDRASLVAQITHMPVTLGEAMESVRKGNETPIAAYFEPDMGVIFLHVLTAEPRADDPKQQILREYVGRAKFDKAWEPEMKMVDGDKELADTGVYGVLLAKSPFSLEEIATKAEAENAGKVMFVQPRVLEGREVFEVGIGYEDYVRFFEYDLMQGEALALN